MARHVEEVAHAFECKKCSNAGDFFIRGAEGAVCLDCAGLGHLAFLPAGSAALTRRTAKACGKPLIVMQRNLRRARYERQGILAEPATIERAAAESLDDGDLPGRDEVAATIREQFPGCPVDRAEAIALHTVVRFGGRGRRRARRKVGTDVVCVAVAMSVLHMDTDYDELVRSGVDREAALAQVRAAVDRVLAAWRDGVALLDG